MRFRVCSVFVDESVWNKKGKGRIHMIMAIIVF